MLSLVNIQRKYRLVSPPGVRAFVLPDAVVRSLRVGALPKLRVTRLHAISYQVSWIQLYATLVAIGTTWWKQLWRPVKCQIGAQGKGTTELGGAPASTCWTRPLTTTSTWRCSRRAAAATRAPRPPAAVEHRPPGIEASDTVVPE
ncbi:hypothetical protein EVAR_87260_1 [Eumeta japonica]|uniref:Uncharacterized protein n=1 Tax=Eumeta variegata TaxID=151549 RepID=A0A4C1YPD9_EUMVA|nr:hypothetical protein EVAR_87260_1 [Eumeta japonica]